VADRAAANGWSVTLLLGPTGLTPADSRVKVLRFRTTSELEHLLREEFPGCDVLVMAAAVADYRPKAAVPAGAGKLERKDRILTLELEPTPDLLAGISRNKRPDQYLVGFALEPSDRLLTSAARKLERKGADMIVANPLSTMESDQIDATLFRADGSPPRAVGLLDKSRFASVLLDEIRASLNARSVPRPVKGGA